VEPAHLRARPDGGGFSEDGMSLELLNTFATFGTFVVITATAVAALVQLRHARSSNQIAALNELRKAQETPEFA
jgi:hypothetical protein